ncbi:MAG TPA: farnesyl diphosphate synthase [Symbiobacteriaceae bacterium]|nr:farnesyl diphosphate synthase [Symbiobacteriaceae bacterium]
MNVADYLSSQSRVVDEALDRYTDPARPAADGPDLRGIPAQLLEAVRYSLLAGGKRLRPVLVMAAAELFGAPAERVMPAACALEMIHTYSLIHDDLPCMDDDDLRRGRPTNHKVYGEAVATLAGDALLTMAFELLGRQANVPGVTPAQALQAVAEVAKAAGAAGMVGGQIEDLQWEGKRAPAEQLKQIHRLKTGALFRASLRSGAILAGAGAADLARLDQYAEHFGLAFQIQDDVLDVAGDAAKTGKGVGRDQKHDKSTYVSHYGLAGASELARAEAATACATLTPYGVRADFLVGLAQFVVDREG